jgi:hypothetical protein
MPQETNVWQFRNLVVQSFRAAQTLFFTGMQKAYLGVLNGVSLETKREREKWLGNKAESQNYRRGHKHAKMMGEEIRSILSPDNRVTHLFGLFPTKK